MTKPKRRKAARARKPRYIDNGSVYAAPSECDDCVIYVGGRYYDQTAQIHLSAKDVAFLAPFFAQADAYFKARGKR